LKRTRDAAEKMSQQYNSVKIKSYKFTIADAITVRVPSKDRGSCDLLQVPGVVVKASNGFHKICTQFGVLTTQYRADELERSAVKVVDVNGWESDDMLSLREAARRFNN